MDGQKAVSNFCDSMLGVLKFKAGMAGLDHPWSSKSSKGQFDLTSTCLGESLPAVDTCVFAWKCVDILRSSFVMTG